MEACAVAVGGKEAEGLAVFVGMLGLADLFRETNGGQRTPDAELLILGDRRALGRFTESPRGGDRLCEIGVGRVVDGDANCDLDRKSVV